MMTLMLKITTIVTKSCCWGCGHEAKLSSCFLKDDTEAKANYVCTAIQIKV